MEESHDTSNNKRASRRDRRMPGLVVHFAFLTTRYSASSDVAATATRVHRRRNGAARATGGYRQFRKWTVHDAACKSCRI